MKRLNDALRTGLVPSAGCRLAVELDGLRQDEAVLIDVEVLCGGAAPSSDKV